MEEDLNKLKGDKKIPLRVLFKRTMTYVKPEALSFVLAFFLLIVNVGLDLVLPIVLKEIINNLQSDALDITFIAWFTVLYFGISVINMVFLYFESNFKSLHIL